MLGSDKMAEKLSNNFYVARSPVFELLVLLVQISEFKTVEKETYQKQETKRLYDWFKELQQDLSTDLLEEINMFFHPDSFFGLSLIEMIYLHNQHHDIEKCLAFLKTVDAKQIVSSFFNTGHNLFNNESIFSNSAKVHKYIQNTTLPNNEKSKLFYLYFDAENTQEKLISVLQQGYDLIYRSNSKQLETSHVEAIEKIKSLSVQQLNQIIRFDENTPFEKLPNTIIIIPSYYHHSKTVFSYDTDCDLVISITGINLIEELMNEKDTEEKIIEFARALSDSKRINIIQELNKQPRYGYELAQRLNLSSPTISHHMSILFRLGLVTTTKFENKIYYEVNKDKLKQSIAEMIDLLT